MTAVAHSGTLSCLHCLHPCASSRPGWGGPCVRCRREKPSRAGAPSVPESLDKLGKWEAQGTRKEDEREPEAWDDGTRHFLFIFILVLAGQISQTIYSSPTCLTPSGLAPLLELITNYYAVRIRTVHTYAYLGRYLVAKVNCLFIENKLLTLDWPA